MPLNTIEEIRAMFPDNCKCKTCKNSIIRVDDGRLSEKEKVLLYCQTQILINCVAHFAEGALEFDRITTYPIICESYKAA